MKTSEEQLHAEDFPRLRVFWGEEDSEDDDDPCPPDNHRQSYGDWVRIEAYWAGRNHAGRRSARIAA